MIKPILRAAAMLTLAVSPAFAKPVASPAQLDTAVFAGGCFWGVQAVYQHIKGVVSATSGYAGGTVSKPDYEMVSTGTTGHAEAVRVVFDPSKVTYAKLLDVFYTVAHDGTQLNRQGPDHGTQYRSAIFYMNDTQKAATVAYIAQLQKTMKDKIVTQVAPLSNFYVAEAYHQDYATLHPEQPYIAYNDLPKVAALKKDFSGLWMDKIASH